MVDHGRRSLVAIALAAALASGAGPCARADVLGWVDKQLGGLFEPGEDGKGVAKTDVSSYLTRLQKPEKAAPGGWTNRKLDVQAPEPVVPTPSGQWAPRVADALQALRSPPGTQGLQTVEDAASRAALLSSRAGFALPAQVLVNLAQGTEPLRRLLVSYREALHDASSTASLDRLHRACQKLLGQVQNNHHLVQLSRELLDSSQTLLDKAKLGADAALERSGEVQAVPMVAAFIEVHLRARSNLESARSYLVRAQASLRTTFRLARSALSYVEQVKEKSLQNASSSFTLEDRPEAIDKLAAGFERMRESVAKALDGMQTAHGLLYVNQKSLLELLYTLRPSDQPRPIGSAAALGIARAMTRSADLLTEGLQSAQVELARQKQWRASLESYHTPLFELGVLPEWIFTKDTILVGGVPGNAAAGPAPDIAGVIASLEAPPTPELAPLPADGPEPAGVAAMTELPLIDLESLPASASSSATTTSSGEDEASYHLPQWY